MKEKIVSIEILDANTTRVTTTSGQQIDCWHMENDHPKVGNSIEVDNCIDPFTPAEYDLRKREHRSPFY